MLTTRRALLSGSALLLGSITFPRLIVPAVAEEESFLWKHYGRAPFAQSADEAFADLPRVLLLLGIPEEYREDLVRRVMAHPEGLRTGKLEKGDRLEAMLSKGGVVHRNVVVAFEDIERGIGPFARTREWDFQGGTLILPLICYNWSWRKDCATCSCYAIPFDYSATPGVALDAERRAKVSVHVDATEAELEAMYADPCFSVHDANGAAKPFHRCETCQVGAYPAPELARAVGLPETAPTSILSFYLQDGKGQLLLPRRFLPRQLLFCVETEAYWISVPGFRNWRAISRFDLVRKKEFERTLPKGALNRTLSGEGSY